jgi:hypothetical protein
MLGCAARRDRRAKPGHPSVLRRNQMEPRKVRVRVRTRRCTRLRTSTPKANMRSEAFTLRFRNLETFFGLEYNADAGHAIYPKRSQVASSVSSVISSHTTGGVGPANDSRNALLGMPDLWRTCRARSARRRFCILRANRIDSDGKNRERGYDHQGRARRVAAAQYGNLRLWRTVHGGRWDWSDRGRLRRVQEAPANYPQIR